MLFKTKFNFMLILILLSTAAIARDYHVSKQGNDQNAGTASKPLLTIQAAANKAMPGDTITVHEGIYRERVNPPRGGTSDDKRIVYQAAPGEKVVIKGSEAIREWKHVANDTWKATVPERLLKDYNPYRDLTHGDWFYPMGGMQYHTGSVYLNGHWLIENRLGTVLKPAGKQAFWACNHTPGPAPAMFNVSKIIVGDRSIATAAFQSQHGIKTSDCSEGGKLVGWIHPGDWVTYDKINFGKKTTEMSFRVASLSVGGRIEVRLGGPDGKVLGHSKVNVTGGWQTWSTARATITPTSGIQSICLVFLSQQPSETVIWAQFKGVDPNKELVEINVRPAVFYPDKPGRNYITVRGFTMEHAATQWAPPTAEQIGLLGVHWSKGWIIENNEIRYSNGVGITLGKERGTGHNLATHDKSKSGTAHYHDVIKRALEIGWSKENIGSHIVRNNYIHHCEQAGIVGSLGAVLCRIEGNTIHDINIRGIYNGCEQAGIKLHAPIDTVIANNHIYRCSIFGIWLDWMAQGTRVTGNLLHDNRRAHSRDPHGQDLYMEVNHGPFLVDNNLFMSPRSFYSRSRGGAYAHNLYTGDVWIYHKDPRMTPYHKPHSTELVGLHSNKPGGDDRYYNNLFIKRPDLSAYNMVAWPLSMHGNVYLQGATPSKHDAEPLINTNTNMNVNLVQEGDTWYMEMTVDPEWSIQNRHLVTTELLGKAKVSNAAYEQADGSPYRLMCDYAGNMRNINNPFPGPFVIPAKGGKIKVKVWPKK